MFKIVTRNSVYTVTPTAAGFLVRRSADMWGREVKDTHTHITYRIDLAVGEPFVTCSMTTTPVLAVLPA